MSVERKLPRIAALVGVAALSITGLVAADQDSNPCFAEQIPPVPGKSDPLEPLLKILAENELEGRTAEFTASDQDLSPASQKALKEHFQNSIDRKIDCTIEIGNQS